MWEEQRRGGVSDAGVGPDADRRSCTVPKFKSRIENLRQASSLCSGTSGARVRGRRRGGSRAAAPASLGALVWSGGIRSGDDRPSLPGKLCAGVCRGLTIHCLLHSTSWPPAPPPCCGWPPPCNSLIIILKSSPSRRAPAAPHPATAYSCRLADDVVVWSSWALDGHTACCCRVQLHVRQRAPS